MLRDVRRSFLFIDRPLNTKGKCEEKFGAVWYDEEEACLRMWWVPEKTKIVKAVDEGLLNKISHDPYGLDRVEAYKNAYHCWVDNKGHPGHPDTKAKLKKGELPKCWFGMTVKSGEAKTSNGIKGKNLELTLDDWMGQKDKSIWDPEKDHV